MLTSLQELEWEAPSIDEQVAAIGELIQEGKIRWVEGGKGLIL
jgi:hypothetical protein